MLKQLFVSAEDEDGLGDDRKKRPRTAFTAAQIKALECEFEKNKYLSVSKRMQLSKQLKLTETQVCVQSTVLPPLGKLNIFFRSKFGFKTDGRNGNGNTRTTWSWWPSSTTPPWASSLPGPCL